MNTETVDNSHYTNKMWFDEIREYLINVIGMNDKQVVAEFEKRFPELLIQELI